MDKHQNQAQSSLTIEQIFGLLYVAVVLVMLITVVSWIGVSYCREKKWIQVEKEETDEFVEDFQEHGEGVSDLIYAI